MALWVVHCEDRRKNFVILGNEIGGPFKSKEHAQNLIDSMKILQPLKIFNTVQITGCDLYKAPTL